MPDPGTPDAGTAGGQDPSGQQGGDDPPAVAKVVVLVNSRPQGAEIYGADGAKLGRTPINLFVEPGKPLDVTLRLRRHKDLKVSIDDRKKKVTLKMEKDKVVVPRPDPGHRAGRRRQVDPTDPGGTVDPPDDPPKDPADPCNEDPSSVKCRCFKDPSLPECVLE